MHQRGGFGVSTLKKIYRAFRGCARYIGDLFIVWRNGEVDTGYDGGSSGSYVDDEREGMRCVERCNRIRYVRLL